MGEKLNPLVIGNDAQPVVFKAHSDPKDFSVTLFSNSKACMTSVIFENWLYSVNRKMKKQDRNISLQVDGAFSHGCAKQFSNVALKFLLPNGTSEVRLGIVKAVKTRFHNKMTRHLATVTENCASDSELGTSVALLDAVYWISSAWKEIPEERIVKWFRHAAFDLVKVQQVDENVEDKEDESSSVPLAAQLEVANKPATVREDAARIADDDRLPSTDAASSKTQAAQIEVNCDGDLMNGESDSPTPSHEDALQHVKQLINYSSFHRPDLVDDLVSFYADIEEQLAATDDGVEDQSQQLAQNGHKE